DRKDFPLAQFHLTMILNSLSSTSLPPLMLRDPKDLATLKQNWIRFWKTNAGLPREEWIREVIDIWMEHARMLLDRKVHTLDLDAEVDYLHHLATLTGILPDALRQPAKINGSDPTSVVEQKLREYLDKLESWWKTERSRAKSGKDHFKPLFE